MKRGWQVAAVALLATFVFFVFESYRLSLRDALGPGPGFFPFWLGMLAAALAIVLLAQLRLDRVDLGSEPLAFDRAGAANAALVLAGLIAGTALLEVAGFRISMLLLLPYLLLILGVRNRVAVGIFALVGSFGVYHLFSEMLKVPLPVGAFGF